MHGRKTLFLLTLLAIMSATVTPALASMTEYYTWGGFDPVNTAFSNIAAIFGDGSFAGGVKTFALAGIFFGIAGAIFSLFTGRFSPMGWTLSFFPGLILYMSLFVPKTSMNIYDPVLNQINVVGNVPVGIVYSASFLNHIERFMVQLLDTNAQVLPNTGCGFFSGLAPLNYADTGGTVGVSLMQSFVGQPVENANASQTMTKYVEDCVAFELVRPGSTLTIDKILQPGCNGDMFSNLIAAASPINMTVNYMVNPPVGTVDSCQNVYNALNTYYNNPTNTQQAVTNACVSAGFSPGGIAQCQTLLGNVIQNTLGLPGGTTLGSFVSNQVLAKNSFQTLLTAGGPTTAQYLTMVQQTQNGVANSWVAGITNPFMINSYIAYTIMLFPFLAMFCVTPLWQKALGLMLSMMAWLAVMRGLDVVLYHFVTYYYQNMIATGITNGGMGMQMSFGLPSAMGSYLNVFAEMRMGVALLATVVSGALFKFGDSALSRLASQNANHYAAHSSGIQGTGHASVDTGSAATTGMQGMKNAAYGFEIGALAGSSQISNLGRGMATGEIMTGFENNAKYEQRGGGGPGGARTVANTSTNMAGVDESRKVGYADNISTAESQMMGVNQAGTDKGYVSVMTPGLAQDISSNLADKSIGGLKGDQNGLKIAQINGFEGGMVNFSQMLTEYGNIKNFADAKGFDEFSQKWWRGDKGMATSAMVGVAAYQASRHMAEAETTAQAAGEDVSGAGARVGGAVAAGNLMSMANDETRRSIAAMNGYGGEEGYFDFMHKISGANPESYSSNKLGFETQSKFFTDGQGHKVMEQHTGAIRDAEERSILAQRLNNEGYNEAAAGVIKMKSGENITMTMDSSGHITGFEGKGGAYNAYANKQARDVGSLNEYTDLNRNTTGTQFQHGTFGKSGTEIVHSDVNVNRVGHGNEFVSPQTTLQMAMQGNSAALFEAGNAQASGQSLETSISHVSSQTAQALTPIVSQKGENANQLVVSAAASAGFTSPVGGMHASMNASGISNEKWVYDRIQNMDAAVIRNARNEASEQGLTGDEFTQHVAGRHSAFVNGMVNLAGDKKEFGVQKPAGVIREVGEGLFGKSGGGNSFPDLGYGP